MTTRLFSMAALAVLLPAEALACGGFFCNTGTPVDQSAERIIFAVDGDSGTIDTHVQIFYSGDAAEFAWIVPVAAVPELFLSTDALFNQLAVQTAARFDLTYEELGDCWPNDIFGGGDFAMTEDSGGVAPNDADADGVTVVSHQNVGPYETVVLQAETAQQLLDWLQSNNYDLPDQMDSVLAPYVASDQYFVALRLQKDKDVGDIAPIGFTYAGTQPAIPIQLTSVAATPDMRLEVYVFADERAVPENYLHVQINEAAINWLGFGSNYNDVITRAADEAGGHAFATDFSGAASGLAGNLWAPGRFNTDAIRNASNRVAAMDAIISQGFPASASLLNVLQAYMPPPSGIDSTSYYNCVECYEGGIAVDYAAFADALDEVVVQPLETAEKLFTDHTTVTRMTSSLSPAEMTIDPMFVQNSTMGAVSNVHTANMVMDCRGANTWETAPRRIELADGRVILVPSNEWFWDSGESSDDFFAGSTDVNAMVIEQTSGDGEAQVLTDNTAAANEDLENHNDRISDLIGAGCGCSTSPGPAGLLFILPLLGLAMRRRQ